MEWFWSQNRRKITQKKGSWALCAVSAAKKMSRDFLRATLLSLSAAAQDGVATKVLAAVAAVVAAAACFRRLRAQQLAATTREIDELRDKLAQQQAPPAPPAPVAQAK